MNRTLTFGEALFALASREYSVKRGKEIYPSVLAQTKILNVPIKLGQALGNLESENHVEPKPIYKLMFDDPWEPVVEKLIGYKFPRKGMSSYFAYYLLCLHQINTTVKAETDAKTFLITVRQRIDAHEHFLNEKAIEYGCKVEEILDAMKKRLFPQWQINMVAEQIQTIKLVKEKIGDIGKKLSQALELSYETCGNLGCLEDFAGWPKHISWRDIVIHLFKKLLDFATPSDFTIVRKEAQNFLKSEEGVRKILLYSVKKVC